MVTTITTSANKKKKKKREQNVDNVNISVGEDRSVTLAATCPGSKSC